MILLATKDSNRNRFVSSLKKITTDLAWGPFWKKPKISLMDGLKSKTLSTAIGYFCGFEMVVTILSTKWLWKCVWWKYVPPTSSVLSSNSKRAILNFQKHSDVIKGCSYAFDAFNDNFKHLLKCATLYDVELRECSVCNISVSLRYFIFLRQNVNLMRLWKSFPINILLTIFLQ